MTTSTKHLETALQVLGLSEQDTKSVIRRVESGESRTTDTKASSHARGLALSIRALGGKRENLKIEALAIVLDHFEGVFRTIEELDRTKAKEEAEARAEAKAKAKEAQAEADAKPKAKSKSKSKSEAVASVTTPEAVTPEFTPEQKAQLAALVVKFLNA